MLVHLAVGAAGLYALARAFRLAPAFAALAGVLFGMGRFMLERFHVGHLNMVYPFALAPLVLWATWKAVCGDRLRWRLALLAGALVGVQILEGGDVPIVYEELALCALVVALAFGPDRRRLALRIGAAGVLVGLAALALSAHQLVPMLDYIGRTGRQGGISLDLAKLAMEGSPARGPRAVAGAVRGRRGDAGAHRGAPGRAVARGHRRAGVRRRHSQTLSGSASRGARLQLPAHPRAR
jgi:hypothetical protein